MAAFPYDAVNRQLTAANAAGTTTMSYDAADRVAHVVEPSGFWLTFGYDLADRRTSVEDSAGGVELSTYDLAGQ